RGLIARPDCREPDLRRLDLRGTPDLVNAASNIHHGTPMPDPTPPSGGEFEVLHELVRKARQNLNQNNWDYIVGGTETETTVRRNRLALESLALRARVLRDVNHVDASTTRFGCKLR